MPQFSYTAIGAGEKAINGSVSAPTREAAINLLRQQNIKPVSIRETKAAKLNLKLMGGRVKTQDLVVFTRQLSTMVSAGVPLVGALSTLKDQTENPTLKQQLAGVVKDVESGISLGDALEKHPTTFSAIYVNMVRAGETGGILDDILKKLAAQQEKDAAIKAKVKSASTYPMVLLGITVIAFYVLMSYVVPKIGNIVSNLGGPGSHLPIQTRVMLSISHLLTGSSIIKGIPNALIFLVIIIVGVIYLRKYIKTPRGKLQFDTLMLKVPVVKVIVVKVAIARFARIFASLMGAGVTVLESLQVTSQAIGNSVIEAELLNAAKEVKNGKQLSKSLSESQFFPPIVSQMLAVGEETGKTDTVLVKVAEFYEEEVDAVVSSLSSILEPVMIVIMGSMVGLIAVSVLGPITGLNQTLANSPGG